MSHLMTWRTALILSFILHLMLLPGLANLSPKPSPTEEKHFIELELADYTETAPIQPNTSHTPATAAAVSAKQSAKGTASMPSAFTGDYTPIQSDAAGEAAVTYATGTANTASTAFAPGTAANASTSSAPSQPAAPQSAILRPQILESPLYYPEQARREGLKGVVNLSIEILTNGQAGSISVIDSSGSSLLDEAAVQSARQWRFIPARDSVSGIAVECTITRRIGFNLN